MRSRRTGGENGASREGAMERALAGLRKTAPADQVAALCAAGTVASDAEWQILAGELVRLAGSSEVEVRMGAAGALVRTWARLSPARQTEALGVLGRLGVRLVQVIESEIREVGPESHESIAQGAAALGVGRAAGALVDLLGTQDDGERNETAKAVARLAGDERAQCRELAAAVCEGARRSAQLRQPELLSALLALGSTIEGFSRVRQSGPDLLDERGGTVMALRAMIRRQGDSGQAGWRARSWLWLSSESLAPGCFAGLERAGTAEEQDRLLRWGHLWLNPSRSRAVLKRVSRALSSEPAGSSGATNSTGASSSLLGNPSTIREMSEEARCEMARLTGGLSHAAMDISEQALRVLAADPSARVRRGVVSSSGCTGRRASVPVLALLIADPESSVARSAAMRLLTRANRVEMGPRRTAEAARGMAGSPHAGVRQIAATAAGLGDVIDPCSAVGRLAARRRMRAGFDDRGQLLETIRQRLAAGDDRAAMSAIIMARHLGVTRRIESDLCGVIHQSASAMAGGGTARVLAASAAVTALGDVLKNEGEAASKATSILRWCVMQHPDARCRSNALEALVRHERREGHWPGAAQGETKMRGAGMVSRMVAECFADAHHRVRGSAVRAAIDASQAAPSGGDEQAKGSAKAIEGLLTDWRPMHRAAGLWLVKRCAVSVEARPWMDFSGVVAEMVKSDPQEEVRVRARACAAVLLARMGPARGRDARPVESAGLREVAA